MMCEMAGPGVWATLMSAGYPTALLLTLAQHFIGYRAFSFLSSPKMNETLSLLILQKS